MLKSEEKINFLKEKAQWVWEQSLLIHKDAPETRIASSLSPIEIFVCLYYGEILNFIPHNPLWEERDRLIISKGHGSLSMYPILADLDFFDKEELKQVCKEGSFLGGIPDPVIPGYETVNGSLGHGLGVGCGMAIGLKRKKSKNKIFILVGDGEMYEGSNWEAIMFAAHHQLDNVTLIIDHNKISMLGHCKDILDHSPLSEKFLAFDWNVDEVQGSDLKILYETLERLKNQEEKKPKVLIVHTLKGRGVEQLEDEALSHIMGLKPEDIDRLLQGSDDYDS